MALGIAGAGTSPVIYAPGATSTTGTDYVAAGFIPSL